MASTKLEQRSNTDLNLRVLDLSRVLAGPYCSMLLADMGANIIKLEMPERGDDSREFPPFKNGVSLYHVNLNRGKKSITLNLKHSEGRRLFIELVKCCDVLIENFSPGTMERLGLGYDSLKEVNPRLIYAAISGFGKTGAYSSRPGYDIIGQAMGGLMSVTGWPDSPPTRVGTAIGDILGALFCCIGILVAIQIREQTGRGQLVDVALVDSVFASLENIPQKLFIDSEVPERIGNRYEFVYPYDSFKALDGWVIIGIANDQIWRRFIEAAGLTVLAHDSRYSTNKSRVENHESLKTFIQEWTSKRHVNEIVSFLTDHRIPACPIYDIGNVVSDRHITDTRGMVVQIDQPGLGGVKLLGNPVKMSETKPSPKGHAHSLGEDTDQVLRELIGVSETELKRLKEERVL